MGDLKFAIRQLLKHPGFTAVAALTLAVGIGANTLVLTWINAVLFRAIPGVPDQDHLAVVCLEHKTAGLGDTLSNQDMQSLGAESSVLTGITGSQMGTATLRTGSETEWIWVEVPLANYFDVLQVTPILGRGFQPGEDQPSPTEKAVVISHRLWQQRFGGARSVLGREVEINHQPATIVGVAPREFRGTMGGLRFDAWIVPALQVSHAELIERSAHFGWRWAHALARLAPGVNVRQAEAALDTVAARLALDHPTTYRDNRFAVLPVWRSPWGAQGRFLPVLLALAVAAGLLLLLVTANVANLLLARAHQREGEMAVRLALGASPWRIIRQVLIESVLLAACGGTAGFILARFGANLFFAMMPATYLPIGLSFEFDPCVLAATVVATLLAGATFGMAPALQCAKTNLQRTLREGGRGLVQSSRHYLRMAFVVGEVAAATVLLIGMALCLRSLAHTRQVRLGLEPSGVCVAGFRISPTDGNDARVNDFYRRLRQEAASIPSVQSVALADWLPLGFEGGSSTRIAVANYEPASGESMSVDVSTVSPEYFSTLRIPILAGREFQESDREDQPLAILINETFANRYFAGRDPLGLQVRFWGQEGTVVGIAGNGKYRTLNEPPTPWFYVNQLQHTDRDLTLVLRGQGSVAAMPRVIEQMAARVDPSMRPFAVMPFTDFIGAAWVVPRMAATLLAMLGSLALFLAILGIYAVVSQQVAMRTGELAIRMALGAPRAKVLRSVLRHGMSLALVGLGLGALAGLGAARVLGGILVGIGSWDWVSWTTMALVLLLSVLAACWFPARRATRVGPMEHLR